MSKKLSFGVSEAEPSDALAAKSRTAAMDMNAGGGRFPPLAVIICCQVLYKGNVVGAMNADRDHKNASGPLEVIPPPLGNSLVIWTLNDNPVPCRECQCIFARMDSKTSVWALLMAVGKPVYGAIGSDSRSI